MPYIRKNKCVYKKGTNKEVGCSDSVEKAKKYLNKLRMVGEDTEMFNLDAEIEKYLAEAAKDGKVLRKLNIDAIRKEVEPEPGESPREYNARLQQIEANPTEPEHYGHFPPELVNWVENLPDSTFPSSGRKMFTKWLANVIYYEETDGDFRASLPDQFKDLSVYEGGVQYIVDFLNGSNNVDNNIWNLNCGQMYDAAAAWHERLAAQGKDFRDNMGKLGYMTNKVAYKFKNGYTIVEVDAEKERDYTEAEAYRCYWAKDYEMASEIERHWAKKNKQVHVSIRKSITDLDIEGCAMGHCVGGYCDAVRYGEKTIFSLRDKKNEPHATIEVDNRGMVRQIKGFGNEILNEKYRPMVKEWLRTTNYEYKSSSDYISLIPPEEILQMIDTGEATGRLVYQLASESEDQEVLSRLLSMVDDIDTIQKIEGANGGALLIALSANRRLGPELVMRLLEKNLTMKVLGRRLGDQFHDPFPEFGETRLPGHELAPLVWEKLGDTLKTGEDEEYIHYMDAIVHYSKSEQLGRQVVNTLLSDEFTEEQIIDNRAGSLRIKPNIELAFGRVLQQYLANNKNHDRDTLDKILKFIDTEAGQALAGGPRRIDSYLARSLSITDDMVEKLLSRPGDLGTTERMNLLANPNVDEKYKYEMLQRLAKRTTPGSGGGAKLYLTGLAGKLIAHDEIFSYKFLQWLAKEGWLWPHFVDMARGELQKGSSKTVDKDSEEVRQLAASRQAIYLHNAKTPDDIFEHGNKFKLFYDTLNLQEDIKKYLTGEII